MATFNRIRTRQGLGVLAAFVTGSASLATAGNAENRTLEVLQQAWRTAIIHTPTPGEGCFTASYPLRRWHQVRCVRAPLGPYLPAAGSGGWKGVVGAGNDYAAETSTLISSAVGSFPFVRRLESETDQGVPDTYSIQLNSNFMANDPACAGASNPVVCRGWQQFVYSSSSFAGFMEYWLVNYQKDCPNGWFKFSVHCYRNSAAVFVPRQTITELRHMTLSGTAVADGKDTLLFTTKTDAYSVSGKDKIVYLANGWKASEFNVLGDGHGSEAVFNAGTALTLEIDLTDGSTDAPTCKAHAGTTGETNNLNLKSCTAVGGAVPSIQFKESIKKS